LDLHHLLLAALSNSYVLFRPSDAPSFADIIKSGINMVARSFALGVKSHFPL
jgi:flagellar biosynthesis protein FliR